MSPPPDPDDSWHSHRKQCRAFTSLSRELDAVDRSDVDSAVWTFICCAVSISARGTVGPRCSHASQVLLGRNNSASLSCGRPQLQQLGSETGAHSISPGE